MRGWWGPYALGQLCQTGQSIMRRDYSQYDSFETMQPRGAHQVSPSMMEGKMAAYRNLVLITKCQKVAQIRGPKLCHPPNLVYLSNSPPEKSPHAEAIKRTQSHSFMITCSPLVPATVSGTAHDRHEQRLEKARSCLVSSVLGLSASQSTTRCPTRYALMLSLSQQQSLSVSRTVQSL